MPDHKSLVPKAHKMERSQAEAWLKALRSGKHEQAAGALCSIRTVNTRKQLSYCCLGIRALIEGCSFRQGLGETDVFAPGTDNKINDAEMLKHGWATQHGLTYEVQLLLSRLNDGNTAWMPAGDVLIEVYKVLATRATAGKGEYQYKRDIDGFVFEFEKHDFPMIANVIEKYFIR